MAVHWDPSLSVGHPEIDGQHQEIFRRFGALVCALEGGTDLEVPILFDVLADYAQKHFAAEEQVMAATRYPGATVHAAKHARFLREFEELRGLYVAAGPTSGVVVKTRTWIDDWLRSHIVGVDQALARHLRQR